MLIPEEITISNLAIIFCLRTTFIFVEPNDIYIKDLYRPYSNELFFLEIQLH